MFFFCHWVRLPASKEPTNRPHLSLKALVGAVLAYTALLLPGCDLAWEESLGKLSGSWQVTGLPIDETSVTAQLNAQYDRLVLTLHRGADGGEFFSLVGRWEGESVVLTVQGTFDRDGSGESGSGEITLTPNSGSSAGPIEADYVISSPSVPMLELCARAGRSEEALLNLIQFPAQGAIDETCIRFSKE